MDSNNYCPEGYLVEKKKLIIIGCGSRGKGYSDKAMAMEGKFEIVGIAEPIKEKQEYFKKKYGVCPTGIKKD